MSIEPDRLISAKSEPGEARYDHALRPVSLGEYVGQAAVKEQLDIFIRAARGRREALDHTLVFGPPGLGKTTLANIIAREMGVPAVVNVGPATKVIKTGMTIRVDGDRGTVELLNDAADERG